MTENKKQEFEDIKKTLEAQGTFSEKEAEDIAKKSEKVTKKLIEDLSEKEVKKIKDEVIEDGGGKEYSKEKKVEVVLGWNPKTKLGREVKDSKITNLDEILDNKKRILEPEIVDWLLNTKTDLISIGQLKGKFGGGKRRAWRQTQRKTEEGNVPTFSTMAVIGNEDGYVGIGTGKAKETLPARDKAIRNAKLNIIKVVRGCSSFDCDCSELHTVPFKVTGKSGSSRVTLIPAPQGTGLVVANELKKVLKLAGIKDVYSKTFGTKRTSFNLVKACIEALKKTSIKMKNEMGINEK